jgi:glycosyltransferase involved in cell wall biosynthesis
MISFIIPAYDEEAVIAATVDAVHAAAREIGVQYEIIVANDASSDRTAEIAAKHGANVVNTSNRQIAATRNAGAKAARGDRFIFVDADTLVNASTVRAAIGAMDKGAVGGGSHVVFDDDVPLYADLIRRLTLWSMNIMRLAAGCFLFCTRTAFETAGGFDERLFGAEELALSAELKKQGPFVVLREKVVTSGRKFRTHTAWDILRMSGRFLRHGPSVLRARKGMEFWYDGRREKS